MVNNVDTRSQRSQRTPPAANPVADKRRMADDSDYEYDVFPSRMPSSARRYHSDARMESGRTPADVQAMALARDAHIPGRKSAIPPRRTATQTSVPVARTGRRAGDAIETEEIIPRQELSKSRHQTSHWLRFHWSVYIGLAMLIMVIGWISLSSLASWWQVTQDDWHYGRPRTFQDDFVVGHNDTSTNPSHFIALNLQRHIEIIEMPGGDASKAKIYTGPVLIGQGQDLAVVTLNFKDVNGDGKPDMIVNIQDSRFVFINDNGNFRQARPGEAIQMP